MICRLIASVLVAALALLTPGGRFYEACAQTVAAPGIAASASAANAAAVGALSLNIGPPSLSGMFVQTSLHGALTAVPAPSPFVVSVIPGPTTQALSPAVWTRPNALAKITPARSAAAVHIGSRVPIVTVFAAPRTFSVDATGEEAGLLFDQSVARPAALDDFVLAAPSDSSGPKDGGLEKASALNGDVRGEPPEADARPAGQTAVSGKTSLPRSLWGLFWGHHIVTVFGIEFHALSQPFLVKDTLGMGTTVMGLVRNIHMGAMALVNILPIGYLIDKTDYRVVFVATSLARALLMGAIPLLFMAGALHFTLLAAIVAANPIFQSAMIVADGAARKSFLGKDAKLNKDAAATLGKWDSLVGVLMPLIAGWVVGWMVTTMGLGGYAMAYGVYAAMLLLSIPFYWTMVRDPRFPDHDRLSPIEFAAQTATFLGALAVSMIFPFVLVLHWAYGAFFSNKRPDFPTPFGAKGVVETARKLGAAALWVARETGVALAGAVLLPLALLKTTVGLPKALKAARGMTRGVAGLADLLERYKPMQGLAYILRNRVLRILTAVMALEVLLIDALPFVLIPSLITDALGTAPTSLVVPLWAAAAAAGAAVLAAGARTVKLIKSWAPTAALGAVASVALVLHFFPQLLLFQVATAGGLLGLLFSVEYAGRFIPSARLEGEKGDALIARLGHGRFYRRAAFASLLFWALLAPVYLTPGLFWINLAIVAGVLFVVQLFHAPVAVVMEPVKRQEMDDDKLARIEGSIFMVDVAFESIGALFLGLLLDFAGLTPALIATALFLTLTAVLQYKVPSWIFPDGERPAPAPIISSRQGRN